MRMADWSSMVAAAEAKKQGRQQHNPPQIPRPAISYGCCDLLPLAAIEFTIDDGFDAFSRGLVKPSSRIVIEEHGSHLLRFSWRPLADLRQK